MGRLRGGYIGSIAVGIALLSVLAGCSSSSSGSSTTTSSASTNGTGAGSTASLTRFQAQLTSGKGLTYKATYSLTAPNGSGTFVVERMPPTSSRFDVSTSGQQIAIITSSTATYICELSKTPPQCVSGIPDPIASFEQLVDPAKIIPALQQAAARGAASVTFSTQTVLGMASTSAAIASPQRGTFCITDQGLLVSVSASNGSITLTGYSTSVPASDFSPPAGATVQSLPAGTP